MMDDYEIADDTIRTMIERIAQLKDAESTARDERIHLEEQVSKEVQGRGAYYADGEEIVKMTITRSVTERIDEEGFSKEHPDLYARVSKPAIDRAKWRMAVVKGVIDPITASSYISTADAKPRTTITRRTIAEEQA